MQAMKTIPKIVAKPAANRMITRKIVVMDIIIFEF